VNLQPKRGFYKELGWERDHDEGSQNFFACLLMYARMEIEYWCAQLAECAALHKALGLEEEAQSFKLAILNAGIINHY
jgi:hypothetical protein